MVVIGDAGSMVDTLTGEGIYPALRSGELAAIALRTCVAERKGFRSLTRTYERLWKKEFKWREFKTGYIYQMFLNSERFLNIAVSRAARHPKRAEMLAGAIVHLVPKSRFFFGL